MHAGKAELDENDSNQHCPTMADTVTIGYQDIWNRFYKIVGRLRSNYGVKWRIKQAWSKSRGDHTRTLIDFLRSLNKSVPQVAVEAVHSSTLFRGRSNLQQLSDSQSAGGRIVGPRRNFYRPSRREACRSLAFFKSMCRYSSNGRTLYGVKRTTLMSSSK